MNIMKQNITRLTSVLIILTGIFLMSSTAVSELGIHSLADSIQSIESPPTRSRDLLSYGTKLGFIESEFRGPEVKTAYGDRGFIGGFHVRFNLLQWFSFGTEVLYNSRASELAYETVTYGDTLLYGISAIETRDELNIETNFKYLDIPLITRIEFFHSPDYEAFINLGVVFSHILSSSFEGEKTTFLKGVETDDWEPWDPFGTLPDDDFALLVDESAVGVDELQFATSDFSIMLGGGTNYDLGFARFIVELRYLIGIPDIEETDFAMHSGGLSLLIGLER